MIKFTLSLQLLVELMGFLLEEFEGLAGLLELLGVHGFEEVQLVGELLNLEVFGCDELLQVTLLGLGLLRVLLLLRRLPNQRHGRHLHLRPHTMHLLLMLFRHHSYPNLQLTNPNP